MSLSASDLPIKLILLWRLFDHHLPTATPPPPPRCSIADWAPKQRRRPESSPRRRESRPPTPLNGAASSLRGSGAAAVAPARRRGWQPEPGAAWAGPGYRAQMAWISRPLHGLIQERGGKGKLPHAWGCCGSEVGRPGSFELSHTHAWMLQGCPNTAHEQIRLKLITP